MITISIRKMNQVAGLGRPKPNRPKLLKEQSA